MRYIGSKNNLLDFIREIIRNVAGSDLSQAVFCDMFAGTGIVGRNFKSEVKQVIANDCEYYSYVLNRNYIGNHTEIAGKEGYIEELNTLTPAEKGIVFNHYCLGGGAGRRYFSDCNGKKIDAVRQKIEAWKQSGKINDSLYYFLLASLLESADKVANTTSVYCSFLKHFEQSAQKELVLMPAQFIINDNGHKVFNMDCNALIRQIEGDILYLDPPYNNRQYGALYHLLNTIARYDRFEPKGKTGLREYGKSRFCYKGEVEQAFADLIENARFKYIFLSYNNEGLMPVETIRAIMKKYGKYDFAVTGYQRFKADKAENRNYKADRTQEYLHILEKRN